MEIKKQTSKKVDNNVKKLEEVEVKPKLKEKSKCDGCPYRPNIKDAPYCFPCMKDLLSRKEKNV